jgi:hypothetical protein
MKRRARARTCRVLRFEINGLHVVHAGYPQPCQQNLGTSAVARDAYRRVSYRLVSDMGPRSTAQEQALKDSPRRNAGGEVLTLLSAVPSTLGYLVLGDRGFRVQDLGFEHVMQVVLANKLKQVSYGLCDQGGLFPELAGGGISG